MHRRFASKRASGAEAMAETVGDFLLKRLSQWGVRTVYGYPGDGINGIMGAFGRSKDMRFIQARHEELAAFMACAHAKFSGHVGVCLATSGPGAIHRSEERRVGKECRSRWRRQQSEKKEGDT